MAEEATGLGSDTLNRLLLLVPAHVLLFDANRICRYAAPNGRRFLGRLAEELVGVPAAIVLADVAFLVPSLDQVLASGEPLVQHDVPSPSGARGPWEAGTWRVYLQPWRNGSLAAGPSRGAAVSGVLLSCHPSARAAPAADEGETPDWAIEGQRSARLLERIRNQLTVIQGSTQALQRRVARAALAPAPEFERVVAAVREADRALAEYERATRLSTRHPDLR
jgi:hypothetical protein